MKLKIEDLGYINITFPFFIASKKDIILLFQLPLTIFLVHRIPIGRSLLSGQYTYYV